MLYKHNCELQNYYILEAVYAVYACRLRLKAVELRRRASSSIVSWADRFGGSYKTDMGGVWGGGGGEKGACK